MRTRRIGSLEVSVIGIGCNNFGARIDAAATDAVVAAALAEGINFFDTADIYGDGRSEELLAKSLGSRRDEVVVATKFGSPVAGRPAGASPAYVRRAVEDSLRRLGTDRIDLYQLHRPDPGVPIAETLGVLGELVAEGKVREVGCSNFDAEQLDGAARGGAARGGLAPAAGGIRLASVQNHYSLLHREPEPAVLEACARLEMAFLPFFPLANGLLTGKYRRGEPAPAGTRLGNNPDRAARLMSEQNLARVEALSGVAESAGLSLLELAFAWLLRHDVVASVIAGATRPEQVRANVATAEVELSADVLDRIDEIAPR